MANIPKIQKALYPHIPKIDPSIPYPFKYLLKDPVSLYFFPISLDPYKPFHGPRQFVHQFNPGRINLTI